MALEARIKELLALDENRKCADCGTRSPRWASYSLGIFMCLQCAGFHRALGVHISRVKSCDLDRWTEDQVRAMEAVGNARGREEYGPSYAEVNNTTYLPDAQSLETFVRSKYVRRLYAKGGFGASFNTPEATAAAAAGAARRPQQGEDLWAAYREPEIDTTSKIRIDWPRKPAAAAYPLEQDAGAAATQQKPQKEPSLIDLFEPEPVPIVQQVQQAAASVDPFFADFAAAPVAAAAAAPAADPFDLMSTVAAPKQQSQQSFASFPLQQVRPQQSFAAFPLQQVQPQQQSQQSFAAFPPQQLYPQLQQSAFDDDFGDFVVAAEAAKRSGMQQLQQSASLFDDDSENAPPPLPAKDYYDPFASVGKPQQPQLPAKDYASPAACAVDAALAGLFASTLTTPLSPSSRAAAAAAAPPAASVAAAAPLISNADIMALYGPGRGGGGGIQSPATPTFANFGGPGASWA